MSTIRILLVVALMSISSLASAQETMKKGDKAWTELEATLREANLKLTLARVNFVGVRLDLLTAQADLQRAVGGPY